MVKYNEWQKVQIKKLTSKQDKLREVDLTLKDIFEKLVEDLEMEGRAFTLATAMEKPAMELSENVEGFFELPTLTELSQLIFL
eukprot:13048997-Ditylum_brightwellii.AAC.2